jgi:DNA-binding MurR/RpiR family transcriptional regulator
MKGIIAVTRRLEDEYRNLPPQLREAARYIAKVRTEVALYSLCQIAARAEVGIMMRARRIYLLGLRCNYGLSFYLCNLLRTFIANVVLLEGRMGMLIDEGGMIGAKDAF